MLAFVTFLKTGPGYKFIHKNQPVLMLDNGKEYMYE